MRKDRSERLVEIQEAFGWRGSESTIGETARDLRLMEEIVGAVSEPVEVDAELAARLDAVVDNAFARERRADLPWGIGLGLLAGAVTWVAIKLHPLPTPPIPPIAPFVIALVTAAVGAWWARKRGQLV